METTSTLSDFSHWSVDDRLALINQIWDSIEQQQLPVPLTQDQQEELARRLDDLEQNPDRGELWDDLKQRLLGEL